MKINAASIKAPPCSHREYNEYHLRLLGKLYWRRRLCGVGHFIDFQLDEI